MADEPGDLPTLVARLYDTYGDRMYRYALMLTMRHDVAADVVHDVFREVLGGRVPQVDPLAYLRRAVRNRAASLARRVRVRGEMPLDAALLEPAHHDACAPAERLALEDAIRQLPVEQREVVHLHVFEGLTFAETAVVTDSSPNTVAARYRYALARLRAALSPSDGTEGSR